MSGVAAPPGSPAPGPAHGSSLAPDTQTWPASRVSLPHRRLGSTRCLPGTAAAAGGGSARLPGSPGWISVTCLACPHPASPELLGLVPQGTRPCRPQALAGIGPTAPGSRRGSRLSGGSCFPGPGFLLEAPGSWGRWAPAGARPLLRGGVLRVLGRPGPGPPQRGCLHVTPGHPGTVKQHGLGAGSGLLSSGGLWGAGHHKML